MTDSTKQSIYDELHLALERIQDFNQDCEDAEFTDTGTAWEVLGQAHDAIERFFVPTLPLSVQILWGESPEPDAEPMTYTFNTQAELRAFRDGIEAGDGWAGYEVVYTDEEFECRHKWRNNILDDGSIAAVSRDYCVKCGVDKGETA